MILLSIMIMILSITLAFSSHPVAMLSIILTQTLLICIFSWFSINTSWLSYILFLIFLGGLMVLFVYVVSLAANEKFEPNFNNYVTILFLSALVVFLFYKKMSFDWMTSSNKPLMFSLSMMFAKNIFTPTMLIMTYLLFTLIVVVKTSSKFEGPLRSTIK